MTTRVIANACEPSSNVPPPTEEASIRSPSTSTTARAGRPRKPYAPEHPGHVDPATERDRPRRAHPLAADREEPVARLDLDDASHVEVGHRRLAVVERRERDGDARRLEPRHRRPRSVDRIDDEHVGGVSSGHQAPILRVERHPWRALGDELRQELLGLGVDREGHIAAGARAGELAPGV